MKTMNDKEKTYISAVIYVNDNESQIQDFLKKLDTVLHDTFEHYEYIIVNDFCNDHTVDKVKQLSSEVNGYVTIINLSYRHGLERAMIAGQNLAIGDFVYEFDTVHVDYDFHLVKKMYETSIMGNDVVSLVPKNKTSFFSRSFYQIMKQSTDQEMTLYTETARIVSRRIINRISILSNQIEYRKASYHYSGLPSTYIFYEPLTKNRQKPISLSDRIDLASEVIIRYSNFASKISFGLSMLFLLFSLATLVYVVVCYLVLIDIQRGWTTTMFFLAFSFSGLFFMVSFLFRYLDILVRDRFRNTGYTFSSVEQIKNMK